MQSSPADDAILRTFAISTKFRNCMSIAEVDTQTLDNMEVENLLWTFKKMKMFRDNDQILF